MSVINANGLVSTQVRDGGGIIANAEPEAQRRRREGSS
jgi:hypothetical protein